MIQEKVLAKTLLGLLNVKFSKICSQCFSKNCLMFQKAAIINNIPLCEGSLSRPTFGLDVASDVNLFYAFIFFKNVFCKNSKKNFGW